LIFESLNGTLLGQEHSSMLSVWFWRYAGESKLIWMAGILPVECSRAVDGKIEPPSLGAWSSCVFVGCERNLIPPLTRICFWKNGCTFSLVLPYEKVGEVLVLSSWFSVL
jgi:hypothetical protein